MSYIIKENILNNSYNVLMKKIALVGKYDVFAFNHPQALFKGMPQGPKGEI